jgi:hypothetical protein
MYQISDLLLLHTYKQRNRRKIITRKESTKQKENTIFDYIIVVIEFDVSDINKNRREKERTFSYILLLSKKIHNLSSLF